MTAPHQPGVLGIVTGGIRLLQGHRRALLPGSAVASIAVLLLAVLVGSLAYGGDQLIGLVVSVLFALPLPVVTTALTAQWPVRGWSEGLPPR